MTETDYPKRTVLVPVYIETCKTCRFNQDNECHGQPPTLVVVGAGLRDGVFVPVYDDDWCRVWYPKGSSTL